MRNANHIFLAGMAALSACSTADVYPLTSQDSRRERGLTYQSIVGVLNFDPFAEVGARASVRRAARDTCGLAATPSDQDIQLEGGPTGVSVFIGAVLSYAFKCPDIGVSSQ